MESTDDLDDELFDSYPLMGINHEKFSPDGMQRGSLSQENCRKFLFWFVQLIGVLIIILTLVHIFHYRGGFGGRNDPKHEFCWHVFFMTLGFTYFSANGLLVFRLMPLMSKAKLKWIHLGLNGGALLCTLLGLFFVVDEKETQGNSHIASLHSWMGIAAIVLLFVQLCSGAFVFLSPASPPTLRECVMPWHIKWGAGIYLLGTAAILTGIKIKKDTADTERYILNFTGVLVIILCGILLHLLTEQNYKFAFRLK